jgi:peroxiredoxin
MNKLLPIIIFTAFLSCNNNDNKIPPNENKVKTDNTKANDKSLNEVFKVDPKALTKDHMTWYTYTYYTIHLSQDFIGLDTDSVPIDKLTFLKKFQLGKQIPIKVRMLEGKPVYKLYNLNTSDESIKSTIEGMAATEIAHFKMEGTEMPDFNFTDINGNRYNKASTKGKLMVVKCWFIHCVACVKEFPDLNRLVDENKDSPDLLFVSLAMDSKQELQKFLKTKEFKYAVVPDAKSYMVDELGIAGFPTHLLINGEGKIIKVVSRIEDLIPFLNRERAKIRG